MATAARPAVFLRVSVLIGMSGAIAAEHPAMKHQMTSEHKPPLVSKPRPVAEAWRFGRVSGRRSAPAAPAPTANGPASAGPSILRD